MIGQTFSDHLTKFLRDEYTLEIFDNVLNEYSVID